VAPNTTVTFSMGAAPASTQALIYHWFTIAGKAGSPGSADGTNSAARFNSPNGMAVDSAGDLYTADASDDTVRKLTPVGTNWVTTTIAGLAGLAGATDGTNRTIRFGAGLGWPAVDLAGNVYVPDYGNQTIRKLTPVGTNWVSSTIAGKAGSRGSVDGTNSAARFSGPNDIALDSAGSLFVVEYDANTIRKLTPVGTDWVTTTIAGKAGSRGSADGTNSTIRFNTPVGLAMDSVGNVFVADSENQTIRRLTSSDGTNWVSSTIAGKAGTAAGTDGASSASRLHTPNGVAVDRAGTVYVADTENDAIRKVTPVGTNWVTTTIGGKAGVVGSADGTNSVARFNWPVSLVLDSAGNVYVADWMNHTVRMGVPLPVFQSVSPVNGSIELIVNAAPGQTVQLQYKSDLASATWTNLGDPITATDGTISATDTPGPDQARFYRTIVVRP
jgi:hypothetical protein